MAVGCWLQAASFKLQAWREVKGRREEWVQNAFASLCEILAPLRPGGETTRNKKQKQETRP
jgi:hypothetical protein